MTRWLDWLGAAYLHHSLWSSWSSSWRTCEELVKNMWYVNHAQRRRNSEASEALAQGPQAKYTHGGAQSSGWPKLPILGSKSSWSKTRNTKFTRFVELIDEKASFLTRAEERPNRNERVSRSTAKQLQPESIQKPNETNTSLSCSALLSSAVLVLWDCWWCPQQSGDGRYCDELSGHAAFPHFCFESGWSTVEPSWTDRFDTAPDFVIESSQVLVKALPSSNALSGAKCQWSESKGTYKNASWSNESVKFNLSRQPPGTQMKSPHCTTWFMSKST